MSSNQQDAPSHIVVLDERVDISRAETIYSTFEEALQRSENVEIDASAVDRIDTAGFQVLVSFCRAVEKSGRKVSVSVASDVFSANARLLGLESYLPLAAEA